MMSKLSKVVFAVMMFGFMNGLRAESAAAVQTFIQNNPDSVVLFYRSGCPYCQYVLPLFDAVEQELQGSAIGFLKVEIKKNAAELKEAFQFSTVPTFIYYKGGQEKTRHGSNNKTLQKDEIEANIEKYIA